MIYSKLIRPFRLIRLNYIGVSVFEVKVIEVVDIYIDKHR